MRELLWYLVKFTRQFLSVYSLCAHARAQTIPCASFCLSRSHACRLLFVFIIINISLKWLAWHIFDKLKRKSRISSFLSCVFLFEVQFFYEVILLISVTVDIALIYSHVKITIFNNFFLKNLFSNVCKQTYGIISVTLKSICIHFLEAFLVFAIWREPP